jgi:uncharacterized membrane protein
MTKSRRQWKKEAKLALKGRYGMVILGMMVTSLVNVAASILTDFFFPGSGVFTTVLAEIFSFLISLVTNVVAAGYAYMVLKLARGEEAQVGDLWYFFKNSPDRVILAGFVMGVLQWIASVPTMIYTYTVDQGTTDAALMEWQMNFLLLMLLSIVLQLLLTLPFTLVYYILADRPEMGGFVALRESARMMKGHMGTYLILMISFVPILFGSILTLYISLIWIIPYMQMTETEFYRDLNGEFRVPDMIYLKTDHVNPGDFPRRQDDYNSEA